jgi:2-methylisocitrate lyase-like PEP mutase family enzyme
LVSGSIEDASGDPGRPIYDHDLAVRRIEAAVAAVRSLPVQFVLTARAENFIRGNPNLDDTIRRLKAYEEAGADVLFAPGLPDIAAVRTDPPRRAEGEPQRSGRRGSVARPISPRNST